jgi:hypothetical protein
MLNLKQPVTTRDNCEIKIYEVINGVANGAWYDEDSERWFPVAWSLPSGTCIYPRMRSYLDLINNDWTPPDGP